MPAVLRHVPDARLAIVGDNRTWPRIDPAGLADELGISSQRDGRRVRGRCASAGALRGSVACSRSCPSTEGFGLTPLEALAAGVPPVVLDTPVAREVYGHAAAYVAAPDAGLVADALSAMLSDGEQPARVLEAAPGVLARYRWEDAAAATLTSASRTPAGDADDRDRGLQRPRRPRALPGFAHGSTARLLARRRRRRQRIDRRGARDGAREHFRTCA